MGFWVSLLSAWGSVCPSSHPLGCCHRRPGHADVMQFGGDPQGPHGAFWVEIRAQYSNASFSKGLPQELRKVAQELRFLNLPNLVVSRPGLDVERYQFIC